MSKPSHVVVFDFDGTLTPKKYVSLFNVVDGTLSEKYQKEIRDLREKYLPKALAGKLTPQESLEWVATAVRIYTKSGLTISQIRKAVSIVNLRPGVLETLKLLQSYAIPVAIISYGIVQFIGAVLEEKKIRNYISQVYATSLIIQDGLVRGYYPQTFIFTGNKNVFSCNFALQHGIPFKNILAIGDSAVDCSLGYLQKNRLGIAKDQAEKEKIKKFFGEVVITESFDPILEWLKIKISS